MDSQLLHHTVEEVEQLEGHVELIDGRMVVTDKTTVSHNMSVTTIAAALRNYISSQKGTCLVFTENVALYCNELGEAGNYFLPDVMVVCDQKGIDESGIHVPPLFVVEITSEATRANDYNDKMIIYRNIGVKEYWIVDLQKNIIVKYLAANQWVPEVFLHPEVMKVSVYEDLVIDVSEFIK